MRAKLKPPRENNNLLYLNTVRGRPLNFFDSAVTKERHNITLISHILPVTAISSVVLPKDDQVRIMIFENNTINDMYLAFDAEATIYGKYMPAGGAFVMDYPNAPINSVSAIAPGVVGTIFLSVQVGK